MSRRSCETLRVPFAQIIEDCFASVFSWLLFSTSVPGTSGASEILDRLRYSSGEFAPVKQFSTVAGGRLRWNPDLRHRETRREEGQFAKFPQLDPEFLLWDPPIYDTGRVGKCLEQSLLFVTNEPFLIVYLAERKPNVLRRVLLKLTHNIFRPERTEFRILAFNRYTYFCDLALLKLKGPKDVSPYLTRDACYTLLFLLKDNDECLRGAACDYLSSFVNRILPENSSEVKAILNLLADTLISIAQTKRIPSSLTVLEDLILHHRDSLAEAAIKLAPIPDDEIFAEIRAAQRSIRHAEDSPENRLSLETEFGYFLESYSDIRNCKLESLAHLRNLLVARRDELERNVLGFGEVAGKSYDPSTDPCSGRDHKVQGSGRLDGSREVLGRDRTRELKDDDPVA